MENAAARKRKQVPEGYLIIGVDPHKKRHAAVAITQEFSIRDKFKFDNTREGRRDKHVIEMAKMYVSYVDSRKANLAILDFAALVCTPSNPKCGGCPLMEGCITANTKNRG